MTSSSFKQSIDRAFKNYITLEIWEETHLREIFYGSLIIQQSSIICIGRYVGGPGGGGTPLYKLYRYVPSHRVGFLRRFGLTTGIDFAHFGLESGLVFEGTTGVYERIYRFNSKWVIVFCLRSNLSNTYLISA